MDLLICYRSSDDEVTNRVISKIEHAGPDSIVAYCHLRREDRTFRLPRIEYAVDPRTGEVIQNVRQILGFEELPTPVVPLATRFVPPSSPEEAKRQRNRDRDRRELYKPFKAAVIADHAKSKVFALFSNACFNCGWTTGLVIDHHTPQTAGGRLVPGNLVSLCGICNGRKLDRLPTVFYVPRQLEALQPILDAQAAIFKFQFDWKAWNKDREAYLLSLGITPALVTQVLNDEDHPMYVGHATRDEMSIGVSIDTDFDKSH